MPQTASPALPLWDVTYSYTAHDGTRSNTLSVPAATQHDAASRARAALGGYLQQFRTSAVRSSH